MKLQTVNYKDKTEAQKKLDNEGTMWVYSNGELKIKGEEEEEVKEQAEEKRYKSPGFWESMTPEETKKMIKFFKWVDNK